MQVINLKNTIEEVIHILRVKAKKNNKICTIVWVPNFEESSQNALIEIIQYEKMKENLLSLKEQIDNHPLLKFISNLERQFKLPLFVKIDAERLKLVLINIISNAINYSHGEVSVKMSFDFHKSQLIFVVTD